MKEKENAIAIKGMMFRTTHIVLLTNFYIDILELLAKMGA